VLDPHPVRPWQNAGRFACDFNPGGFAEPERISGGIDRVDPGSIAELIEERVAGNLDRVAE